MVKFAIFSSIGLSFYAIIRCVKRVILLPNVITAFGLSCGLFAIFKLVMVQTVDLHVLTVTALILLLAALADLLDGAIARVMKAESEFGGQFDSMADAITFGVAPAVFVLKSFPVEPKTALSFCLTTAAMVFSMCGVLRLIRYNLASANKIFKVSGRSFSGLPIPAAAGAAVSFNLFLASEEYQWLFGNSGSPRPWSLVFVLLFLGYLMVSHWKYRSFQSLRIKIGSFSSVFFIVAFAVIIFYGLLHYFPLMFFLVTWSYVFGSLGVLIYDKIRGSDEPPIVEEDEDLTGV